MTSKFSIDNRELLQRISSGEAVVGIDFGNLIVRELARMALAAMDSEPDCKERKLFCSTDTTRMRKTISVSAWTEDAQLYRHAQPAPVVPDAYVRDERGRMMLNGVCEPKIGFGIGWNACRAAMLAAAPHDTPALNSVQSVVNVPGKWIPVSERMPETDGNYWGWWSESKRQGPVWFIKSELQAQFQSHEITHWMPLPAAPQEVSDA